MTLDRAWQQFLDVLTGLEPSACCPTLDELQISPEESEMALFILDTSERTMTHTEMIEPEVPDDDIPPYVRLNQKWCVKFRRPCYSPECHTVCKLAP